MYFEANLIEDRNEKVETKQNEGIIKKFNEQRGFGFIERTGDETKSQIFFHIKETMIPKSEIIAKTPVTFELQVNERSGKNMAVKVTKRINPKGESNLSFFDHK